MLSLASWKQTKRVAPYGLFGLSMLMLQIGEFALAGSFLLLALLSCWLRALSWNVASGASRAALRCLVCLTALGPAIYFALVIYKVKGERPWSNLTAPKISPLPTPVKPPSAAEIAGEVAKRILVPAPVLPKEPPASPGMTLIFKDSPLLGAYGRKPWTPPTGFVIRYQEAPLNHQTIFLMTPTDRTRRSLRMFVDPNYPTTFVVTGISIRNEGSTPLQPDVAYLSFSARVDKWQSNSGLWEPSPDRNINGWSTYRTTFYRGLIEPGHPLDLVEFLGTPVPSGPTRVKVSVVYGLEETTAEFTLKPPST